MTNRQPRDRIDVSSSTASTSYAEKRKEYNRRYYAKHKENSKVLKVSTGDISQRNSSLERLLQRTLPSYSCQMTQMPKRNVPLSSIEKRKERNKRYYARSKENGKRQMTQMPKENLSCTSTEKRKEYNKDRMFQFTMTNGQPKDRDDVSSSATSTLAPPTSIEKEKEGNKRYYARCKENGKCQMTQMPKENVSCTSTEKQKEYNKDRMFQFTMTNGQTKDRDGVSSSTASTLAQKRKEYNARYYASRKENNRVLKVCIEDISQSDSSIERITTRSLQNNSSQMTQMRKENVSLTSTEKQKELCQRYDARCKVNGTQITQPPTDDHTPATTLRSVNDTVMLETSKGTKKINSKFNPADIRTNVAGLITVHKKTVLAAKKVALKDVQNDNTNLTHNTHSQSLIPVKGQLFADASKTSGTKSLTPENASSPDLTNNGAREHFNYPCRKYEFEGNRDKYVGHPKSGSLTQIQQEAGQISGKNVHYGYIVRPNQTGSKADVSRIKESNDEHWAERFIQLQNFIKQCDGSDHRENMQLPLQLSPLELRKHAVELEKRVIQLTIEEEKEMQRMQALNISVKPLLNQKSTSNNTAQEPNSKAANK